MARNDDEATTTEKMMYSIPEAARLSSLCRSSIYREMDAGRLAAVKIGRRRLIPSTALRAWIDGAPAA